MDHEKNNSNFIVWFGIAALIAIPVYFIIKHIAQSERVVADYNEDNIFASELE